MLIFLYFCVMVSAMAPNGEHLASLYSASVEHQYRAFTATRAAIADEIADLRTAA